jgi:hypothetical protein
LFRIRARVLIAWLSLSVALLPLGVGAVGVQLGRSRVDQALRTPFVDTSQRERIREEGYREARSCVAVGGAFSAPPLLLSLLALALAHSLLRAPASADRNA